MKVPIDMTANLNILSYLIYFPLMSLIIIRVGRTCHDNGIIWMDRLFTDRDFVRRVNKLLLIAYYLLNIGYVAITLQEWPIIDTYTTLFEELATNAGLILLMLALLHFFNIGVIWLYHNRLAAAEPTTKTN